MLTENTSTISNRQSSVNRDGNELSRINRSK